MRYLTIAAVALTVALTFSPATAQDGAVKIGVLDDMTGPYADNTGPGDVQAVRMAIADFGGSVLGKPIEIISADMQSKVDVGVAIARQWLDKEQGDMIIRVPHPA